MSIVDQLRREIGLNIRALCTGDGIPLPKMPMPEVRTKFESMAVAMDSASAVAVVRDSRAARRILRIEVDHNGEVELFREHYRHTGNPYDPNRVGPLKFEDVDVYVVDRLPAPGWRVINPYVPVKP